MDREKIDNGKNINSGRKHRNGGKKKLKNFRKKNQQKNIQWKKIMQKNIDTETQI